MNWLYSAAGLGPFQNAKMVIESSLGFDKKSLHILVGFVIFALIRWVFKCRIRTALAAVLAAALLGEVLDIYELIIIRSWAWHDIVWPWHYVDVIDTMGGPIILALSLRLWGRGVVDDAKKARKERPVKKP